MANEIENKSCQLTNVLLLRVWGAGEGVTRRGRLWVTVRKELGVTRHRREVDFEQERCQIPRNCPENFHPLSSVWSRASRVPQSQAFSYPPALGQLSKAVLRSRQGAGSCRQVFPATSMQPFPVCHRVVGDVQQLTPRTCDCFLLFAFSFIYYSFFLLVVDVCKSPRFEL